MFTTNLEARQMLKAQRTQGNAKRWPFADWETATLI
jgi:hypothetical protein